MIYDSIHFMGNESKARLRIAQIASIDERVPPRKYGGPGNVVSPLTEALVARGHEVTLFASGDSLTSATLCFASPISVREPLTTRTTLNMLNLGIAYSRASEFDVVHDHTIDQGHPSAELVETPVIITLHNEITPERAQLYAAFPKPTIVPISYSQISDYPHVNTSPPIYNGIDVSKIPFGEQPDSDQFLLFVGRVDPRKGLYEAIRVAQEAGIRLKIAAKYDPFLPACKEYFDAMIKPSLDGTQTEYVGEVDAVTRNELMGKSTGVLHLNRWNEPFGLVVIEAMACGAPVIGSNKGALPELISEGKTGFITDSPDDAVAAVHKLGGLDRGD